jgi:hypothetical protein
LKDCTTNCRHVLSSERAPQNEDQSNCPTKERKKKNLVIGPKGVPDTKTESRLAVGHKINSTQKRETEWWKVWKVVETKERERERLTSSYEHPNVRVNMRYGRSFS